MGAEQGFLGGSNPNPYDGQTTVVTLLASDEAMSASVGDPDSASVSAADQAFYSALAIEVTEPLEQQIQASETPTTSAAKQTPRGERKHELQGPTTQLAASSGRQTGEDATESGDPEGTQNILKRIAQCLPAGVRPALTSTRLNIQVDEEGALSAAPVFDADLLAFASKEELEDANRVIQAALQCGPYREAGLTNANIDLVADFSFLPPSAASVPSRGLRQ